MVWWVVFTLVLLLVLAVLTLAWWRIGDQWADAEHKRFGPGQDRAPGEGPVVLTRDGRRADPENRG